MKDKKMLETIVLALHGKIEKAQEKASVGLFLRANIQEQVIATDVAVYAKCPVMIEPCARVRLVKRIAAIHKQYKLPGAPPPRPSVDRWLAPIQKSSRKPLVPSLEKYLVLALAIETLEKQ